MDEEQRRGPAESGLIRQDLKHLAPGVARVLEGSAAARIEYARTHHWVAYPRAAEALKTLSDLLTAPRTKRTTGLLLCARAGNGKSTILDRFRFHHPLTSRTDGETTCPVVAMDMPSNPTETRFWSALLDAAGIAHRDTDSVIRKSKQALSVLAYLQCRMLIIDEFHNLLLAQANHQRQLLGLLKNLVNELSLPIVVAGTEVAIETVKKDEQVERRFEDFILPRWTPNANYQRLIKGFESLLPLAEPSRLYAPDTAAKLHFMSGATIRGLAGTLQKLAVLAIEEGRERIDPDMLGWIQSNEPQEKALRARAL